MSTRPDEGEKGGESKRVIVQADEAPKKGDEAPKKAGAQPPKAGKRTWRFLRNTVLVSFLPRTFWRRLAAEGVPTFREVLWPHTILLSALGGVAALIGGVTLGREVDVIVAHSLLTFVGSVIMVLAFGLIARAISGAEKGSAGFRAAFAFGVYGLTPMLILGVLHIIPVPLVHTIAGLLALPYAFYVISLGVGPVLAVPDKRGAEATGLLAAAALLAWTLTSALAAVPVASEAGPAPLEPPPATVTGQVLSPPDAGLDDRSPRVTAPAPR